MMLAMKKHFLFATCAVCAGLLLPAVASAQPAAPDSDMKGVLNALQELKPKPIENLSAADAREQPTPADAVKTYLKEQKQSTAPEKVGHVDNRTINGPGGDIKIRIYRPDGDGPFPVIVYYHGGGFVIADLDVYDATPRALSNATQAVVVSSHYRQGPEHKFPAAHEDAFAAYQWVTKNAGKIHGDPVRIAVAGESAGGNLAAAVCLMARDQGVPAPIHQLLVYPVTDNDMNTPSYQEHANAKPLNKAMMAWFFRNAATPDDIKDPRLGLLKHAKVTGLPPATVITAQIDPLRSEGKAFADKLRQAGVPVEYQNFDGVTHEFFGMGAAVKDAKAAQMFAAKCLKQAFAGGSAPKTTASLP